VNCNFWILPTRRLAGSREIDDVMQERLLTAQLGTRKA
jgi:hypothetical protein